MSLQDRVLKKKEKRPKKHVDKKLEKEMEPLYLGVMKVHKCDKKWVKSVLHHERPSEKMLKRYRDIGNEILSKKRGRPL